MSYFSTRPESDVLVIAFENPAALNDFRNSPLRDALYELVQAQAEARFAVDLSQVDYLSSSGVAILVGLKRRVEARNGKIVIYHVQPIVRDLLAVMKLDRFFTIADDEEPSARLVSLPPHGLIGSFVVLDTLDLPIFPARMKTARGCADGERRKCVAAPEWDRGSVRRVPRLSAQLRSGSVVSRWPDDPSNQGGRLPGRRSIGL